MRFVSGTWRYGLPLLVLALLIAIVSLWVAAVLVVVAMFVLWFFRDPERVPPPRGILSPADGKVTVVRTEGDRLRVGVFMNVLDVHVNRAPVAGTVIDVDYRPGAHRPAFSKDSERNERFRIRIAGETACDVDLIAGAFARRITPYVSPGDEVARGERIGHIAFGSRADVLLPPAIDHEDLDVGRGDRVRAGETILALGEDV